MRCWMNLRKLKLWQFVGNDGGQDTALNKFARKIETIVSQLNPLYKNDESKLEALRSATVEVEWA